jgi:hypothetical protein
MSLVPFERRRHRSTDDSTALKFQLESTRKRGGLDAVALSDRNGLLVAWSGEDELCAELGAVAPMLAHCPTGSLLVSGLEGEDVAVRPIEYFNQRLYLSSLGGGRATDSVLAHSAKGIRRILTAN